MTVRLLLGPALLSCACSAAADPPQAQSTPDAQTPSQATAPAPNPTPAEAQKPTGTTGAAAKLAEAEPPQPSKAVMVDGKLVNADALALKDFTDRINAYMDLHNKAKGQGAAPKQTEDAAQIAATQDGLARRIQALRLGAKPGDIFTPAIRNKFRRLMYPETNIGDDGADAKKVLKDDAPAAGEVPLKVNTRYTADSLATTPSNILLNLPTLPKGLEFRVVGSKHLILLDVDASLIVDYIPNAIS